MSAGHDPREPHPREALPREPLDAEERVWAGRLRRIGPSDGPSPTLDAKILAAAHAAASGGRRRRRIGWFALPPALVTGVGVAAAAALALGLVWQLRPRPMVLPADAEGAGGGQEIVVMAEPAGAARPARQNPPPFVADPGEAAPAPRRSLAPARAARGSERAAASSRENAAAPSPGSAAIPAFHPELAGDPGQRSSPAPAPAPAPPPPAAESGPMADASAAAARQQQAAAVAQASAEARQRDEAQATAAREAARRRPLSFAESPQQKAPTDAGSGVAAMAPAQDATPDETTLDRIEVTGSRLGLADVPVREDRQLAPEAWLERIRARRDQGDVAGARESLRLFRRDHPRARLPGDLRRLDSASP